MNRERWARKALINLGKINPAPLTGSQVLEILFKIGFLANKEKGISLMEEVVSQVKNGAFGSADSGIVSGNRILLTGVPVGPGSDKVVKIIEQSGAIMVALENCSGYKQALFVDENSEPMDALAEQYLTTPCSVMSPNAGRFDLLKEMIRDFSVDGVIDLTWQACHTYNIEAFRITELVQETLDIPPCTWKPIMPKVIPSSSGCGFRLIWKCCDRIRKQTVATGFPFPCTGVSAMKNVS